MSPPRLRTRRSAVALAAAAAVVAVVGVVGAASLNGPAKLHFTEQRRGVAVIDGPRDDQHVTIDTDLFTPAGVDPQHQAPAVILSHGFGSDLDSERADAMAALRRGFVVLTYSARGFGRSTGQVALDSPDYEVKDVQQLITMLAADPSVQHDGPTDPRVGLAGGSYGGAISLITAALDSRVDAVAAAITWNDLADSLNPGGVFKQGWASLFFGLGTLGTTTGGSATASSAAIGRLLDPQPCPNFIPADCDAFAQAETSGVASPATVALLKASSVSSYLDRLRVPTLLMQGEHDTLFPLSQARTTADALRQAGVPTQEVWINGGHDSGFAADAGLVQQLTGTWFDRYLRRDTHVDTGPAFQAARAGGSTLTSATPDAVGGRLTYPLGAVFGQGRVGKDAPTGQIKIVNPPGGQPAAFSSQPGLGALGSLAAGVTLDIPTQNASFTGPILDEPVDVVGGGSVTLNVASTTGSAVLFAKLYDVDAQGTATLPFSQLTPIRLTGLPTEGRGKRVAIALPTLSYRFATGHRIRLTLATTDQAYLNSRVGAQYTIDTTNASFTLPLSTAPLGGGLAPLAVAAIALAALALLVALAVVAASRRRAREEAVADAAATAVAAGSDPVVIRGLSKRYGESLVVSDVDLTVRSGQVLGLLGPNGAGKTTTLRMVLGLIGPTAGEVDIFGTRVTPGSAALRRVGAFIEGSGFVPTLSGMDNLKLWWRSNGADWADAHSEEAIAVAGLGAAIDRKVKTYSQGMRQRLAIAQAMLGDPDLVVLDEPTNGLDPPQIVEMRRVITGLAARGTTVIVSSHLLSEVEQVCSHVAVMSQGRLITTGTVAEVIGADRTVAVEVAAGAADSAAAVARGLHGVRGVDVDGHAVVVELDGVSRVELIRELVLAGVPVVGVAPRKALEQAFLELVS